MVSTEGGLAILGLNEDSLVAYANHLPQLEGTPPATSAAEAATLLDARGIVIRHPLPWAPPAHLSGLGPELALWLATERKEWFT